VDLALTSHRFLVLCRTFEIGFHPEPENVFGGMGINHSSATIITSINSHDSKGITSLSNWTRKVNSLLIIIGDKKTPSYPLELVDGISYISLHQQFKEFPKLAEALPVNHYSRKNIGYVKAHQLGVKLFLDTDDDNCPTIDFFKKIISNYRVIPSKNSWINVYRYFGQKNLWPRGLPLSAAYTETGDAKEILITGGMLSDLMNLESQSPLSIGAFQSLVDNDPDLDAIGRMLFPGKHDFENLPILILNSEQMCPTNSQATLWCSDLLPLAYLPITSSFRMTDIWRGIIIQEFMSCMGYRTAFGKLFINQERNPHSQSEDFISEVSGHIYNEEIRAIAKSIWTKYCTSFKSTLDAKNVLYLIYEELVSCKILLPSELKALAAYLDCFTTT
jgi:hypothetical protein